MEVVRGLESFPRQRVPLVLALGTFDGVHRGHRVLIDVAVRRARDLGGRCGALTFDPHPLQVIAPPAEPFLLTTVEERLALLAAVGLDLSCVVRFDDQFRLLEAPEWPALLARRTGMAEIVCGSNYTFGRDRGGDVALLAGAGAALGFTVHVVPQVQVGGAPVSSTLIRGLIRAGDVAGAAELLGRWYALSGEVIRGDRRGTALGFPTANLLPPQQKVLPATGIYAGFARTDAGIHPAAVSIGTRPTFGAGQLLVEAHLLDASEDLYGAPLRLEFVRRLRDEMAFASAGALVAQMEDDVAQTRRILAEAARPGGA